MLTEPSCPKIEQSEMRTLFPMCTYAGSVMFAVGLMKQCSPIAWKPPWRRKYSAHSWPSGRHSLRYAAAAPPVCIA
jgi:hypothetical protein